MTELTLDTSTSGKVSVKGRFDRTTITQGWPDRSAVLKQAANNGNQLEVDLAAVERVDTAALAVLVDLVRQSRTCDIKLHISHAPDSLVKLAKISDVTDFLPLQ